MARPERALLRLLTAALLVPCWRVRGLRMVDFFVPEFANRGDRITLRCGFEIEHEVEEVYSVKWYKVDGGTLNDMTNFYTYKPSTANHHLDQAKRHKAEGVKVALKESNETQVTLNRLRIDSSGTYKCEVTTRRFSRPYLSNSLNQPRFNAIAEEARMQVVELPTAPPEIGGGARNYAYGDDLNLNCTSKPSYPPTRLTWYINNQKAVDSMIDGDLMYKTDDDLYVSSSFLSMKVHTHLFRYGEIRIKCVAELTEEPIKAHLLPGGEGFILDVVKLPEAMKLQTENTFDVSMISGSSRSTLVPPTLLLLIPVLITRIFKIH